MCFPWKFTHPVTLQTCLELAFVTILRIFQIRLKKNIRHKDSRLTYSWTLNNIYAGRRWQIKVLNPVSFSMYILLVCLSAVDILSTIAQCVSGCPTSFTKCHITGRDSILFIKILSVTCFVKLRFFRSSIGVKYFLSFHDSDCCCYMIVAVIKTLFFVCEFSDIKFIGLRWI